MAELKKIKIVIKRTLEYPIEVEAHSIKEAKEKAMFYYKNGKISIEPIEEVEPISETKKRTELQNKALHLWFQQYATALMEKGITVKEFVERGYEIFPSAHFLKEEVFKRIMNKVSGLKSTTDLDRHEIFSQVQEYFAAMMSKVGNVQIPFPSKEIQHWEKISNEYEK